MKSLMFILALLFSQPLLANDWIEMSPQQIKALGLQTATVSTASQAWGTVYPAAIAVPNSQLRVVSAPMEGLLESLLVAEGETVKKGQVLALVRSPGLVSEQRNYLNALNSKTLLEAEIKREKKLHSEGIIAERRYLETHARLLQARTDVEQAQQILQLAGMDDEALSELRIKRRLSSEIQVRSELDGVILEQMATPGQRLNILDPLYKVGYLSPLWVEIHVPLEQASKVTTRSIIQIEKPALSGQVITVGRMVHGTDQGVLIRAELREGIEQLRPGQFLQARIGSDETGQMFRIPRSALLRADGKTWVFEATERGFHAVAIELISEEAESLLIRGDLRLDSRLVVAGTSALKASWLEGRE